METTRENGIVISRRLSWTVIITLALQFFAIVWFARGIEARVCALEQWFQRNATAIESLDVLSFRMNKMSEILTKIQDSQIRMERDLSTHVAQPQRK